MRNCNIRFLYCSRSRSSRKHIPVYTIRNSSRQYYSRKQRIPYVLHRPAQGTKSAQYIGEHGLATKVAVLYDSSADYNSGINDAFVAAAEENGLEVVADEAYTADSNTDFSVQLKKIKTAVQNFCSFLTTMQTML